jgi:hypothetical protein
MGATTKEKTLHITEKLLLVQSELKAPKGQYNSFGKYKYRSCEDILEAVKPLLSKHRLAMTVSDELKNIGDRYYVEATVRITDLDSDGWITVKASAREEENKKGMDGSQITGAASSYARKYALNGTFLIDDTKDSDATNTHDDKDKKVSTSSTTSEVSALGAVVREAAAELGLTEEQTAADWKAEYKNQGGDRVKTANAILEAYREAIFLKYNGSVPAAVTNKIGA